MRLYNRFNNGNPPNQPTNLVSKAFDAVGSAVTGVFRGLDQALEDAGLLSKLEEPAPKSDMMSKEWDETREKLSKLKLDNQAVVAMEAARVKKEGDINTPLIVKVPFLALCFLLDVLYDHRPIQVSSRRRGGEGQVGSWETARMNRLRSPF